MTFLTRANVTGRTRQTSQQHNNHCSKAKGITFVTTLLQFLLLVCPIPNRFETPRKPPRKPPRKGHKILNKWLNTSYTSWKCTYYLKNDLIHQSKLILGRERAFWVFYCWCCNNHLLFCAPKVLWGLLIWNYLKW